MQTHLTVLLLILLVFLVVVAITAALMCLPCCTGSVPARPDEAARSVLSVDSALGNGETLCGADPASLAVSGLLSALFELVFCCTSEKGRRDGPIDLIRAWILDDADPRFWFRLIIMELVECGGTIQTLFRAERLGVPPVRSVWPIWGYVALSLDAVSVAPLCGVLLKGLATSNTSQYSKQVTGFVGKTALIVIEILADSFHFATAKGFIDAVWSRTGEYKISGAFFLWWAFINMLLSSITLAGTLQLRIAPRPPWSFAVRRLFYAFILAGFLMIMWQLIEFTLTNFRTGQCELVDCYAFEGDCDDAPPSLRDSRSSAPRLRDSRSSADDDYLHPRYDRVWKCEQAVVDINASVFCGTAWTCFDRCFEYRSHYDPPEDNYFVGLDTRSNCEVYFSRRMDDYSRVYPIFLNGALAIFLLFWLYHFLVALYSCRWKCDFEADQRADIILEERQCLSELGQCGDCCACCSKDHAQPSCCTSGNCLKCLCCLCVDQFALHVKHHSNSQGKSFSTSIRDSSLCQPQPEPEPQSQSHSQPQLESGPQPESQPKSQL